MPTTNPSRCFNSASAFAISASTSIRSPTGIANSRVPIMNDDVASLFCATYFTSFRPAIFLMIAPRASFLVTTASSSPLTTTSRVRSSRCPIFFVWRTPRTPEIICFASSKSGRSASSSLLIASRLKTSTINDSPSLRSAICCHSSSVMNGMKGCMICSSLSNICRVSS